MRSYFWRLGLLVVIGAVALLITPHVLDAAYVPPISVYPVQEQDADSAAPGGSYVTIRPSASSAFETIGLSLNEDGSAELASNYHNDEPPIVEVGTWVDNGDGTLTVTLTGQGDETYAEPVVITFQQDGTSLQSVDAEERYGEAGLHLLSASEVASDLSKSLFTIDLAAGFALDPTFVSVNGGGEVDARFLGEACAGFIHRQPVVTVNWSGEADLVRAFFVSDGDPTLMILTPDGEMLCNDDVNRLLLDPSVQISDPVSGTYRIWVGSAVANQLIPGVLVLTTKPEVSLGTFDLDALIQRPVLPETTVLPGASDRDSIIAAIEAEIADAPSITPESDAVTVAVTAEGTVPLFQLNLENPQCNGQVGTAPDFIFQWTGPGEQLSIFFEGNVDSTLLVFGAGGDAVACNDDADLGVNVNPLVVLTQPPDGLYGIWVGRIDPTQPVSGTLTISLVLDAAPAVLAPVPAE